MDYPFKVYDGETFRRQEYHAVVSSGEQCLTLKCKDRLGVERLRSRILQSARFFEQVVETELINETTIRLNFRGPWKIG